MFNENKSESSSKKFNKSQKCTIFQIPIKRNIKECQKQAKHFLKNKCGNYALNHQFISADLTQFQKQFC